ncbi:lysozyme inhibitor LprI family protein [Aquirhabdus parva]|uniref:DUF1311 domain-containing protein n=1 Tax=Aquirhabdus parva TaxID=2283318 RepID=A0A345P5T4_9GAMM|nr:lysozyme inhibitor LprI family protein [Aquirhabdus parva]AXI02643.1 DUF1311 domain-containing protein [Aquirhabdus parva]
MSKTRDLIQEIKEVRHRRQFGSAMAELPSRLSELERAFSIHTPDNHELTRYFPVALIATVEGYFRLVIKDIVDHGEPYFSNAERLASTVKLDFSIFKAMHGKSITFGELIAHVIPLSRIENLDTTLTCLIGEKFLTKLSSVTNRWDHEVLGKPNTPMIVNSDQIFADVSRTFELRHIVCHELASAYEIKYDEVSRCFESCVQFLRATDELISNLLYPDAALTQVDMNIAAYKALEESRNELSELIKKLYSRLESNKYSSFNSAQEKWEQYCEEWSRFKASDYEGGSIWPTIVASAEKNIVKDRNDEIKGFIATLDDR